MKFKIRLIDKLPESLKVALINQDRLSESVTDALKSNVREDLICILCVYPINCDYVLQTFNILFVECSADCQNLTHEKLAEYILLYSLSKQAAYNFLKEEWDNETKNQ